MWCLLEANTRGLIDSRQARRYDRTWQRKCRIAIEYILTEKARQEAYALLRFAGDRLACGQLDRASVQNLLDIHRSALQTYTGVLFPWEGLKGWGSEQQQAIEQYHKYCGNPADPAYREEIQRTAQELIEQAAAAEENSEESLERLLNERTLNER